MTGLQNRYLKQAEMKGTMVATETPKPGTHKEQPFHRRLGSWDPLYTILNFVTLPVIVVLAGLWLEVH
jgi:hypothetical protein